VLVYGAGAVELAAVELSATRPYLMLLGAFLLSSLILAPLASAAALRISIE
jgi:heme exporter protein B